MFQFHEELNWPEGQITIYFEYMEVLNKFPLLTLGCLEAEHPYMVIYCCIKRPVCWNASRALSEKREQSIAKNSENSIYEFNSEIGVRKLLERQTTAGTKVGLQPK